MFQGLSTALTALYASRQALDTTGNNIANVNTDGYSRQRVDQNSMGNSTISFWSMNQAAGLGVQVKDISRIRDQFLEARGLTEHSAQGELQRGKDTYATIEVSFGEPGDNSLQSQLSSFWSAWDDLASNPGDLATRSQVIEQGQTLVSGFQQSSSALKNLSDSSLSELKANVSALNAMAQNVADLNKGIQSATNAGDNPNSLLDQRDQLVMKMSGLVGLTVTPTSAGSIDVSVNGFPIVHDGRVTNLEVDSTTQPVSLRWDSDNDPTTVSEGTPATIRGGDLGGLMTAINTTIPKYQSLLDGVAQTLITTVNNQHALGLDQNGNPGGPFFAGTDASTLSVDPTLAADPSLLAAAGAGGGQLDAENARAMANLASSLTGTDSQYRKMVDVLGTESQRASRQLDIQTNITNQVDTARQAVSGVNLDEEMTNMVNYQKAYTSAAKYLSVINEVMDSLINMVR